MARGWESKSVEDQIGEAEAAKLSQREARGKAEDRERETRRRSLMLSRSRTKALLDRARNERYRVQLQRTLDHLDNELRILDHKSSGTNSG